MSTNSLASISLLVVLLLAVPEGALGQTIGAREIASWEPIPNKIVWEPAVATGGGNVLTAFNVDDNIGGGERLGYAFRNVPDCRGVW